jgi:competence protein ComEA
MPHPRRLPSCTEVIQAMKRQALLVLCFALASSAFAIEVNSANQAQLEMVKGIGTRLSEQILAERTQGGPFKDWADLSARVKGMRAAKAAQLSSAGLTVNGAGMVSAETSASAPR